MAELALARPIVSGDMASIQFMHEDLKRSGLTPEDVNAYPVAPIAMGSTPGYCIPYEDPRMYRIRYKRDEDKYIQPKGIQSVWWSPHQDRSKFRTAPTLYIIEGEKKAAKFVKTWPHLPALGLGGCWMFAKKNDTGIRMLLPELLESLTPGQNVVVIFDGDITQKPTIQQAAYTLNTLLIQQQCSLKIFRPPKGKGVDDWLVDNPKATLFDLIEVSLEQLAISRKSLYEALEIQLTDKGFPIPNETNITKLLVHSYSGILYNDRRRGILLNGEYVSIDKLEQYAAKYIQEEHIANCFTTRINTGVRFLLQNVECDKIKEMVEGLEWDEEPRLNTWAADYFEGVEGAEYISEWGRLLMTALVFRILMPGTKVDFIPILVGEQSIGKTTFFEHLSVFDGHQFYHSCTHISSEANDANRSQGAAFEKAIVVDLGEGAAFNPKRVDSENFKQFVTNTHDEFRKPYEKSTTINPRSFIFVGTSNKNDQITDVTGNRRFLPITVTKIKKLPYATKLQIMAEVVAKQQEIRETDWWQPNIDWDKIPQELKAEQPHIRNIQTLVNARYVKPNELDEYILQVLEAEECATFNNDKKCYFLSAVYLAGRYGGDPTSKRFFSPRLAELSNNPNFPWKLSPHKPRLPQLTIPKDYLPYYTQGISNAQQMLTGYKVTKR